jgi:hypothetical protein
VYLEAAAVNGVVFEAQEASLEEGIVYLEAAAVNGVVFEAQEASLEEATVGLEVEAAKSLWRKIVTFVPREARNPAEATVQH